MLVRLALPADQIVIEELDDSFDTETILQVDVADDGLGFRLRETSVSPPLRKEFPRTEYDESGEESEMHTFVAFGTDDKLAGYVRAEHSRWNHRLIIRNLAIAYQSGRQGLGRLLMETMLEFGKQHWNTSTAWLEVTNVNVPAVKAYGRLGFKLCGLDLSLYENTPAKGEIALYMSRCL